MELSEPKKAEVSTCINFAIPLFSVFKINVFFQKIYYQKLQLNTRQNSSCYASLPCVFDSDLKQSRDLSKSHSKKILIKYITFYYIL